MRSGSSNCPIRFTKCHRGRSVPGEGLGDINLNGATRRDEACDLRGDVVQPADIVRENLLIYAKRPEDSLLCREVLRPAGVWLERYTNVHLTEAVFALIKADMGVACLANWAIVPQIESGDFVARRIGRGGWKRTWWAATWPEREAGPLVGAFVKCLQHSMKQPS